MERNVCRCTSNIYSDITQFVKLSAGEQLCRRCTHRKVQHFKTFKLFSWKITNFELWHCCCDTVVVTLLLWHCCCGTVVVALLLWHLLWHCCCDTVVVTLLLWHCCCDTVVANERYVNWNSCIRPQLSSIILALKISEMINLCHKCSLFDAHKIELKTLR